MTHYAGIDVSLETSSICIVDGSGAVLRELRAESEPGALAAALGGTGFGFARIGLEAGPMSQWIHAGLRAAGLPVVLLETRHLRAATKAMPVKADRTDARAIAQMVRTGWSRAVRVKSELSQELRALLTACWLSVLRATFWAPDRVLADAVGVGAAPSRARAAVGPGRSGGGAPVPVQGAGGDLRGETRWSGTANAARVRTYPFETRLLVAV